MMRVKKAEKVELIFSSLKELKNPEFDFLQSLKSSILCKLKNAQKTWISFFQASKTSKNMNLFFPSSKDVKKHEFHFLQD